MRIKSIELAWFRGAAEPVSLEPNCKSMVVYGENGSGKSSFVDAVEYVLNNGSIRHLSIEYSGSNLVNAIPNTHKPAASKTALRFKFKDATEHKIDFNPNGSSKSSGAQSVAMHEWEYRRAVLRQNEVSDFIHSTKGEKYSALLPLFGLDKMEVAAENLRQLARVIEAEGKLKENKVSLLQLANQRNDTFGTKSDEDISKEIDNLYAEYCEHNPTIIDQLSRHNELDNAIDDRVKGYTANNQRHFSLVEVAGLPVKKNVDAVRTSSVDLAGSVDSQISQRIAVLRSANVFAGGLNDAEKVECPACGQEIAVDAFREHIKAESDRLQESTNRYDVYKASIGKFCDTLTSLKSNLGKPDLKIWRERFDDPLVDDGVKFLEELNFNAIRESCTDDILTAVESELLPILAVAELDSKVAPPEVEKLTADKKRTLAAKAVIAAEDLSTDITNIEALIALLNSLEQGVRSEIRHQSQSVIDSISNDIESIWGILHPGEKIENVRLSLPTSADKAVDVVLKFHGKDQDSPRLTLSEGYRNSLGLCIFLALAKQVNDKERPLFLDDVVVSLDRNHRGMILDLLEKEFSDRQVIIFTHDREWYTELRHQLDGNNRWTFKALLPYETPDIGIRWSHRTTTFDDARAQITERPESAGNDARRIMDVELSLITERLKVKLPYLRFDKNDKRVAYDFLTRLVADGKKCFEKKSDGKYIVNTDATDAWSEANGLLTSWGNRGTHTFNLVKSEATKLIDACEIALGKFKCDSCNRNIWLLTNEQSEWVQCGCGDMRWRYGKG